MLEKLLPPLFEIGPKAYLYGDEMLALAKIIDRAAKKYDVRVILTPNIQIYTELPGKLRIFSCLLSIWIQFLLVGGLGQFCPRLLNLQERRVSC